MAYNTLQKAALIKALKKADGSAVSAAEIIAAINASGVKASKSTVYRLLNQLVKQGAVSRSASAKKNQYVYSLNDKPQNCLKHLHLQCEKCRRLIHLNEKDSQNIQNSLKDTGFLIDSEHTTIWGLCEDCKNG